VSGHKSRVVNAPVAHWIAATGNTEKGIAVFLIKNDSAGIEVGNPLNTLGYAGCAISDISLDGCVVDSAYVMGPFEDEKVVRSLLAWEDQILTAASLGLMKRSMDAATAYAKGRKKTGKPLIAHQEVGFKLAEMLSLWQTCQLLFYRWAWMADTKDRETQTVRHCAKAFCAESAEKMASSALEVMAGEGFICGNPAEQDFRNSKYLQISGTPSAQSRIKIADNLLDKG